MPQISPGSCSGTVVSWDTLTRTGLVATAVQPFPVVPLLPFGLYTASGVAGRFVLRKIPLVSQGHCFDEDDERQRVRAM